MPDIVTVRFIPDHRGVGQMLDSDGMRAAMERVGEEIKLRAETLAAAEIYSHPDAERKRRAGMHYRDSFHVKSHLHGGATSDRAEAIVYNDAPSAIYVEWGHSGLEPYHIFAMAAFGHYKRR